jgi:predicted esterase YcpF (UPF0227 family)
VASKIIYIHGFGSQVDPKSEKYYALSELGEVVPIAPDYSQGYQTNALLVASLASSANLLVGTSMGGYLASRVAADTGLPFVAINPVLLPRRTLTKYLGTREDYYGKTYKLDAETVRSYPVFAPSNKGLVLLDTGDELIDAHETVACLAQHMKLFTFAGGTHRFSHITESICVIKTFLKHQLGLTSVDSDGVVLSAAPAAPRLPRVLTVNTEDESIFCPICSDIVLEQTTPELRDDPPEPCPCSHVKFLFLDNGYAHDPAAYEFIHDNVAEWLDLELILGTTESPMFDRESDILMSGPLVTHVIVDKPTLWAPFYRVLWGFHQ